MTVWAGEAAGKSGIAPRACTTRCTMRAAATSPGTTPSPARALPPVAGRAHPRTVSRAHGVARILALALALAAPAGAAPGSALAQTVDAPPSATPLVHAFAGVGYTAGEARDGFWLGEVVTREIGRAHV